MTFRKERDHNLDWFKLFIIINLIGISSNLDNTSVGIAYGLKNIRFPFWLNFIVNLIGFVTALVGVYLGSFIARYISSEEAAWVSFSVLCSIGLFIVYSEYGHQLIFGKKQHIKIQNLGIRQGIFLGFTLSFSNIITGFGAAISNHLFIWPTVISITIWGIITIWLGNKIGKGTISKLLGKYSSLVSGLLFILVAFYQIL